MDFDNPRTNLKTCHIVQLNCSFNDPLLRPQVIPAWGIFLCSVLGFTLLKGKQTIQVNSSFFIYSKVIPALM